MAGSYNLGSAEGTIKINYDGGGAKKAQDDFKKTDDSAKKSGMSMVAVGEKAMLAGGLIAAGLAYATSKAMSFEKQISAIGAVSGASGADLEALRQKALRLGSDTAFSASEAAQAMEELAKAGVSTSDILNGAADATVALAAAGGVALPDAAAIAANAMTQFGLTAQQLPKVVDQIAGAANSSAIDVGEFGYSISQVGAVAHLAGISFEDTATAITLLGQAGIKGSDAGTSLKTFLQNLIPTTKEQINLSKELGLITKDGGNAFFDASGKAKSLADISGVLQGALRGMTKEQQLATLQTLFGADAIRAAAILAQAGTSGFNNLAASMNSISAADVAAARLDNTAGKLDALKGNAETAAIAIGTLLLPALNNIVSGITSAVNWFNALSDSQKKIIITVLAVAAGILIFVGVVTKIIAIVKAFQAVWIALNASFLFSPVGLVIIAIVALIAVIVLIATKTTWFQTIWAAVWGFMKGVGAWFAGPFAGFFVDLWNKIFPVLSAIGDFFVMIWNRVIEVTRYWWGVISGIVAFFAPAFAAAFGLVGDIIKTAWSIISAVFMVMYVVTSAIFNQIWGVISFVAGAIWARIMWLSDVVMAVWNRLWNSTMAIITIVWGFIGPYVMAALALLHSMISATTNRISSAWNASWGLIKAVASAAWDFILGAFRNAVGMISGYINAVRDILARVRGFFNALKDAASGGVGSLISFVAGIPGKILGALGDLAGMLYSAGKKIIQGLINGIRDAAGGVKDAVDSVLSKARSLLPFSPAKEGPFSGSGWTLYSGRSIADSLAQGINEHAGKAVDATMRMVADVSATARLTNPLVDQFQLQGGFPSFTSPATQVSVAPQVVVVADFGDGVRQVVRSEVSDAPGIVADSANRGNQTRTFLAPGRAN